jgi:flavin-dependent dehydrogenase
VVGIGDAFTFVDAVFSTGVLFAMQSAFAGADTVKTCLDDAQRAPAALQAYSRAAATALAYPASYCQKS